MSDGHSGLANGSVFENRTQTINSALSALQLPGGAIEYILHASPTVWSYSGLTPEEFLADIGFSHFAGGGCQFFHDRCWYRMVASVPHWRPGVEQFSEIQQLHEACRRFTGQLDALWELRRKEREITAALGLPGSGGVIFGEPATIEIAEGSVPLWVEDIKFPELRALEARKNTLDKEIAGLVQYLPLVFATGDALEDAVVSGLRALGLDANRTAPSTTFDVYATNADSSRKFRIEVTGIEGAIKKSSNKIGQVAQCLAERADGEQIVLLANTYRDLPVRERAGKENFTVDALRVLGALPVLLMTGWNLYQMVGDVLSRAQTSDDLVNILYSTTKVLSYP